jgi:arylformamidase
MQPDEDLTSAYANAERIPEAEAFPPRWRAEAQAMRATLGARARTGISYGPGARQSFDVFLPEGTPRGLMVFVHGGYWKAFEPADWSGFAEGALARGWGVAMPGYTLAPQARIAAMTDEIEAAIGAAAAEIGGPLVLTGHSAGGHLSARMACADRAPGWGGRLRRVVPISPLADLRPLLRTEMNEVLRLDAAEAASESPAFLGLRDGIDATVWVGAQERPAFVWQARLLSEEWDCPWHPDPGRHHFDVIDPLRDPASPLMTALLDGL